MTRRLCTICARGGSKRVLNKNARLLAGKPLIGHTIEQAQASKLFDTIIVDSDSDAILDIARDYKVDHVLNRPAELASDTAGKIPVIHRAYLETVRLDGEDFDTHVDLDATSPLRLIDDIRAAVDLFESGTASSLISGSISRRSPYFNLVEERSDGTVALSKSIKEDIVRGQDVPKSYDMNASIYAWRTDVFKSDPRVFYGDTIIYVMPEDRSIDIDTELDFEFVSFLLARRKDQASR